MSDATAQDQAPVTLDSIRQQYPQYKDVPDEQLARGLHERFYSDMAFNDFASKIGYKPGGAAPLAHPTSTPTEGTEKPGLGTELGNAALDVGSTVARGVGDVGQTFRRLGQANRGDVIEPYDAPGAIGSKFAAPFAHESTPVSDPTGGTGRLTQSAEFPTAHPPQDVKLPDNPVVNTLKEDVAQPIGHMAAAAATLEGARGLAGAGRSALDTGVNALNNPTAAQAETLASNPKIGQLRQAGFKITGGDARNAVNAPDSDIHGPVTSHPDTTDTIQRHNRALATRGMAEDVQLGNTSSIQDDQIAARKAQEGKVYQQVGDAIGSGRQPTVNLDHDLAQAGAQTSDPEVRAKIDKQVQFYRDHFKGGFDGPQAVQTLRTLRNDAATQMASDDPSMQAMGRTNRSLSNAIEEEMMRQIPVQQQSLKTAFPAAREQLAKLHDLEAVTEGGQVNASKVLNLKKAGAPLSGAAADVANAADVAPESMAQAVGPGQFKPQIGHYGIARTIINTGGKAARAIIPGLDESTEAFQTAHYGPSGKPPVEAPPPKPAPNLELEHPPGTVTEPLQREMPAEQGRPTHMNTPAPPFELHGQEGPAFEPAQRELKSAHGDAGVDKNSRPMAQADWDQQSLDAINRYKGEKPTSITGPRSREVSGAPTRQTFPYTNVPRVPRELTPAEKLRAKLGEAMK